MAIPNSAFVDEILGRLDATDLQGHPLPITKYELKQMLLGCTRRLSSADRKLIAAREGLATIENGVNRVRLVSVEHSHIFEHLFRIEKVIGATRRLVD